MIETIGQAASRALTEAGFVDVGVRVEQRGQGSLYGSYVDLSVSGMCPCGVQSRFGLRWYPGRPPTPEAIHAKLKPCAIKHIEKDRAEGRWT
jgi:hypothetical protein